MDCGAAQLLRLDHAHLADDAARPDIFVDDPSAADLQLAGSDDIHAGRHITFGEQPLPAWREPRFVPRSRPSARTGVSWHGIIIILNSATLAKPAVTGVLELRRPVRAIQDDHLPVVDRRDISARVSRQQREGPRGPPA